MRILLLLAHEIEEYMQVRLMHDLGHEVSSIGAYIDPAHPLGRLRPALPQVPMVEPVKRAVDALGQQGFTDTLMAAKKNLPDEVIDWAEVIICHHWEHTWLVPQWNRIRHKRVIWRTVGQSTHGNEFLMRPLRGEGLEIVRYSPKERHIPEFAGEDALIRFWMDPDEWTGWRGDRAVVTNITQALYRRSLYDDLHLSPPGSQWTSWQFWEQATQGLQREAAGPESENIGGRGMLDLDDMKEHLRACRVYLYTGTQPASYTLGFIEAAMTGIPIVSIGPTWHRIFPYGPDLFEAHEMALFWSDVPSEARAYLRNILVDQSYAQQCSERQRAKALDLFAKDKIAAQWANYLEGRPVDQSREFAGVGA